MFKGVIDISYGSFSPVCLTKDNLPLPLASFLPLFAPILNRPLELVLDYNYYFSKSASGVSVGCSLVIRIHGQVAARPTTPTLLP